MDSHGWHLGPLLGFDTETTGVDVRQDRIVSAAIIDGDSDSTWLVDPGVDIPAGATQIHGITTPQVRRDGLDPAQALAELSAVLTKAAAEAVPVVVYRAGFDLSLLYFELERHGLSQPPWPELNVIDPYVLDKQADRYRKGKRTLGYVCAHYGVELSRAHSAAADARAAVSLARVIGRGHAQLGGMSPADLHTAQVDWHAADAASLEAYLRGKGRDGTVDARWPMQC